MTLLHHPAAVANGVEVQVRSLVCSASERAAFAKLAAGAPAGTGDRALRALGVFVPGDRCMVALLCEASTTPGATPSHFDTVCADDPDSPSRTWTEDAWHDARRAAVGIAFAPSRN